MQEDNPPLSYPSLQEEDLKKFREILTTQGQGLEAIVELLRKETNDVNIMLSDYQKALTFTS